jgi:catechol 2,3-dioxygenase-like lactoylglutathione lyase family enzyme
MAASAVKIAIWHAVFILSTSSRAALTAIGHSTNSQDDHITRRHAAASWRLLDKAERKCDSRSEVDTAEMPNHRTNLHSRREILQWLGAGGAACVAVSPTRAADLPLRTSGLEHFGLTVPDPEASARFYGRIFDPQLFQERDPPPRFYCKLGTGYLAFGGNKEVAPYIDHFCTLTDGYGPGEARKLLEAAGVPMGNGPLGMATDPDGLRLQLLAVPGGLARTIIPATRISQDEPLFQAIAPDHIMLHVSDLEKSTEHYRKIFGKEVSRTGKRVWFGVAKTRLGLERVAEGEKPSVHHICVKVAGFDRKAATAKLKSIGVEALPANDETLLRFRDPNGIVMELMAG